MKEIEKYIGYYLLVYLVVLAFCGFFQYMYECQGQSLSCAFSKDGFNTIITTTAYVLTPIVAIIGFLSWKKQHNKNIISNAAIEIWRNHSILYYKYTSENKKYLSGGRCDLSKSGEVQDIFFISRELLNDSEKYLSDLESNLILVLMLTSNSKLTEYFYRNELQKVHFSERERYIEENIIFHDFMIKFIEESFEFKELIKQYIKA
ncbi:MULTISPECIES: hypothetical protein [Acinetobacter]|uniref:DUF4760 domain-containing protein n=1 Tax=Acinetobacter faecalis TaxID=2665161 RepID=A0AB35UZX6_9GAMM|nr:MULTISPECIES: hypothetical protein [Acinetobacter]MDY6459703.1 hypothetical protein [Acinetobacter faecalis]MDY6484258.1 hypothetical protein [Acinetobacter faecalis]MDY6487493.1 hypothetical protein [Acinetobacter faecalis]MDY6524806.1 hypothetical protein [Acinetobacter faecalis]MDY6536251.1 hypothetical protein [Acinetobacter faecalis]